MSWLTHSSNYSTTIHPRVSWIWFKLYCVVLWHDDVMKWKHFFPRNWPFVKGIHRSPVDSLSKGQLRRALMYSLMCAWTNGWANNRDARGLRRYRTCYGVIVLGGVKFGWRKLQKWYMEWLLNTLIYTSTRADLHRIRYGIYIYIYISYIIYVIL